MPPRIRRTLAMTARAACVTVVAFFSTPGHAAEVHVLSAAAMQSVFKEIRDEFQTNDRVQTCPSLRHDRRGERMDYGRRGSGPDRQLVAINAARSSTREKSRPAAKQRFAKPVLALWWPRELNLA